MLAVIVVSIIMALAAGMCMTNGIFDVLEMEKVKMANLCMALTQIALGAAGVYAIAVFMIGIWKF